MAYEFNRRDFLRSFGLASATWALTGCGESRVLSNKAKPAKKPNIVLVMTDDQGWGDVHTHNNDEIDTPVMDRLRMEGARFDRFYVSPCCAPTRASLLTGRYYERTGVHGVTRGYGTIRSNELTMGEVFQRAGYVTGCVGKWHNGGHYPYHPNGRGFEEFFGFCGGHHNNYFDAILEENGHKVETKGYITDVLTDETLKFIEENKDRTFLCYVPYNAPHSPWQVPDKYFDKYKARGWDDITACVYGMCENLDDNLDRILKKVDDLGLADDTIFLFLTDNGPNSDRYNGGMKGRKSSSDEGGIRVPLFIRWPGHIKPGTEVKKITAHIDLLPTLVDLTGVKMPKGLPLDGRSLVPLLEGQAANWPDRMLFAHWWVNGSVRTERWRAVTHSKKGNWYLYDMIKDPGQKINVAKKYPKVFDKLSKAYTEWYADVTKNGFDPIAIPIGYPQSPEVVLPGHEAFLEPDDRKGISYLSRSGWTDEYITNWTSLEAYPYWVVDVVSGGVYEIALMYCCPQESVGAKLRVEIGGKQVEGMIKKAHNPEPLRRPDRVRIPNVIEKVWAPLAMGKVRLTKGKTRLCVRALSKPGKTVMDLKAVKVTKIG